MGSRPWLRQQLVIGRDLVMRQIGFQVAFLTALVGTGIRFATLFGAGWWVVPTLFTSSAAVRHQVYLPDGASAGCGRGLSAFIGVRFVGMVARTRGGRWVVLGPVA
ncbi:MAG TPA: hypothetical protein VMI11_01510 [Actinomycetes bacterium]|nr:hypothetical protein [Actinomycetes bacterium]